MSLIQLILKWYYTHKRNLPWRENAAPYTVWLSEIILQQTRVKQGVGYYEKFLKTFPKVQKLAEANQQVVLNMWQGLGYYTRAINLHKTAKIVAFEHNYAFPNSFISLKKLPGIGNYTAAAIASICFGEKVPAIDGNAYRVYSRYFGLDKDISDSNAWKFYFDYAQAIMPGENPGDFNQAIMELGATVCKPKNPLCTTCPVQEECIAYATGRVNLLPIKSARIKIKKRYLYYYYIQNGNQFLVNQRSIKGIWKNMYDFPREEYTVPSTKPTLFKNYKPKFLYQVKHMLTHRQLFISFYEIELTDSEFSAHSQDYIIFNSKDIAHYPFPKPIAAFLQDRFKV